MFKGADTFVERTVTDPTEVFKTWLLQRVAGAVEAGEVSADLRTDTPL